MNVEIKNVSDLGRELSFTVEKEIVAKEQDDIVASLRRDAVVEGFRKGKVPAEIITTRFMDTIREHLIRRIVPKFLTQVVREKGMMTVGEPEIFDVKMDENGMAFKAYTEIKPEVRVSKYAGLTLKKAERQPVTDERVEQVLSEWEKKPEFAASVIDPEKRKAWKEKILGQLEYYAETEAVAKEEEQLWNQLLEQESFPLPEKLVRERATRFMEDQLRRMNLEGKSQEEIEKIAREIFEKVKPAAEREIRKYFVLDCIAEQEKIVPGEQEIEERIVRLGRITGDPVDQMREKLSESGKIADIIEDIRLDKAFVFVKEKAVISRIVMPGESA